MRGIKEPIYKNSGVVITTADKVILVDGENSGELFSVPYKGYMGSTFKILKQSSLMNRDYVLLFFELNQDLYKSNKIGAAIPHLNKNIFKNLIFPIPPINEQKRIADVIKCLYSTINLL